MTGRCWRRGIRRRARRWFFDEPSQWEVIMRFRTAGILLLGGASLAASVSSQIAPSPPATTRTVVAATKLATVIDTPLYFKALRVTLPPGERSDAPAPQGIIYQIAGSTEIAVAGNLKTLGAGEGLFIPGGTTA